MRVVRIQWPVGQGCFATGRIETAEGALHYVYDCGARSVSNLEPVVAAYARTVPHVDALFVSHLDGDHVDGLDMLLARLDVKTVYLPYLSVSQRLMAVAEAEAEDRRLTASFVQAQFEPETWFASRGVERVVFVRSGDPDPDPDLFSFRGPPGGDPEGRHGEPGKRPDKLPEGEVRGPQLHEMSRTRVLSAAAVGVPEILEMEINSHIAVEAAGRSLDWILKPYVPRVSDNRVQQFAGKISAALGLAPGAPIGVGGIKSLLKTPAGRRKLRSCYEAILTDGSGKKHNAVSMSLYSGPLQDNATWLVEAKFERTGFPITQTVAPGWIGTGDAKLKAGKSRRKWMKFYRRELALTQTLMLPHHGSKANFDSELLSGAIRICVAAADERDEGYRHPSDEVVEAIDEAGLELAHVTKRLESRFRETIWRP